MCTMFHLKPIMNQLLTNNLLNRFKIAFIWYVTTIQFPRLCQKVIVDCLLFMCLS